MKDITVVAIPRLNLLRDRVVMTIPPGATVAEIVDLALPGVAENAHKQLRVTISGHVVEPQGWRRVRPKGGTEVAIRVLPAGDNLSTILTLAVTVAAVALGQYYLTPMLVSQLGMSTLAAQAVSAAIVAGAAIGAQLLINAFIPLRKDEDEGPQLQSIQGFQNSLTPNAVIPSPLGTHRMAPPYAARPYTEIVGDDQYVVAAFLWGFGPLDLSDFKLGDTPLSEFTDVQHEVREGYDDDEPLTLYRKQVLEEQLSILLKGGIGVPGGGFGGGEPADPVPHVRVGASDASQMSVDVTFPTGLVQVDDKGRKKFLTVAVRIRYRLLGEDEWTEATTLSITARQQKIVRRTFRWTLPERGRYEVEVTRMTPDRTGNGQEKIGQILDECHWSAIRSFRPEYPINFGHPVAVSALRIKATEQTNGIVNTYNGMASRLVEDWDAGEEAWVTRATSNPASLLRHVLRGPENRYPKTDSQIELNAFASFHAFCVTRGLAYNRVHDGDASLWDVLQDVAGAGRASAHDLGDKWSVVIDRPQDIVIGHVSPRNSWDFKGETKYAVLPDAFRIRFNDETNDFTEAERVVPFPGVEGSIDVTEEISLPGITSPALIWKEARKRQYELIHRRHRYTCSQDFEHLQCTRGDLVKLNHDVLSPDQHAARVLAINGDVVTLDDKVTFEAGKTYACSFRLETGANMLRSVFNAGGEDESAVLLVVGSLTGLQAGDLALFGETTAGEAFDVIVHSIECADNLNAGLVFVDHAPQIDALVAADEPPAWDGRVGEVLGGVFAAPAVPVIMDIMSGIGTELEEGTYAAIVSLRPGSGGAPTVEYEVDHRLAGEMAWTTITVPVAQGAAFIPPEAYEIDDEIEVRARARSELDEVSAYTSIREHTIGEADPVLPPIVSFTAERQTGLLWRFEWTFGEVPEGREEEALLGVKIRGRAGVWESWDDLSELHSGHLTVSPWNLSLPSDDETFTFAIVAFGEEGSESAPTLLLTNIILREDGTYLLREDGSFFLRET